MITQNCRETATRIHHPFSPSTLQNLEACPCYASRADETPHVRTVAGTKAHAVAETGEDDETLSDEDASAAAECLDFVEQRRRVFQAEADLARRSEETAASIRVCPDFFKVTELKETYLAIDDIEFSDCEGTTAGYVDHVLISHDRRYAEMFDWKFGMWPVTEAGDNLQGIAYSLGLFKRYPDLQQVRFFFKQPHLGLVSEAVFDRAKIPALYLRVQTVVARAREARAKGDFSYSRPAVPVCNFCSNLGRCPAVAAFACHVGHKFHPLAIPADITPTMLQDASQTSLGLNLCSVLKVWCGAFRRQITDRVLRREAPLPPGQRIVQMTKREIIDMTKYKEVALQYLTADEFETTLETSLGAVETLVQDKAPRGSKSALVSEFKDKLKSAGAVRDREPFSFLRPCAEKE